MCGPRKLLFAGDHDTAAQRYGPRSWESTKNLRSRSRASRLVTHEIRIQGAQGYCWDFPIAIAAARDLPLEKFVTHTFPLEQLQQALNTALDRGSNSIKVIVKP